MPIQTIHDVPELRPLARIADKLAIELVVFGSIATRAVLRDRFQLSASNLFELSEQTSDIDLAFLGPESIADAVRQEISQEVPMAPWFRWSLVNETKFKEHLSLVPFNWNVPLRNLRIGSSPNWTNVQDIDLEQDVDGYAPRLLINKTFADSPRAQFDSELSAAFVYLDTVLDLHELRQSGPFRPVRVDIHAIEESIEMGLRRLDRLGDMRTQALRRLWYRAGASALRTSPDLFRYLMAKCRLDSVLLELGQQDGHFARLLEGDRLIVLSAALSNGQFRVDPAPQTDEDSWNVADNELNGALREVTVSADSSEHSPILAAGNQVIAVVRGLKINHGDAPSSFSSPALPNEFIYVGLPVRDRRLTCLSSENLTAVVIGHMYGRSVLLPVCASVSTSVPNRVWMSPDGPPWGFPTSGSRWTLRLNVGGLLEGIDSLEVFVLARTNSDD